VSTAKPMAMNRMKETDQSLSPLVWADSDQAIKRNHVSLRTSGRQSPEATRRRLPKEHCTRGRMVEKEGFP
jgi:hypothetical protein